MQKIKSVFAKYKVLPVIMVGIILVVLLSSLVHLYEKSPEISQKIQNTVNRLQHDQHHLPRFLVNPLIKSDRQISPDNIQDLSINANASIKGQWSAPIDWNVTAIHSILLPDYSVMTFGSFGIDKKEDKDIRSNKVITLTDGRELERDSGNHQWHGHDVNSGIDFDIWYYRNGFGDQTHKLFKKPIIMDAFCSVVRVLDLNRVFIVGGNKNPDTNLPDTQNGTMLYNIKEQKFETSEKLVFKRWYGSVVITGDNKMVMMGGKDVINSEISIIPEIIDLNNIELGWSLLQNAKSTDLFGEQDSDEWNYPRAFLASDGNIVGISYNKIWVMDRNDDYRIFKTSEIPLVKGGISRVLEHKNPNKPHSDHKNQLKLLTIGSAVGSTNSAVMIGKDKVIVFGGEQKGDEYSPSNKVYSIDFANSLKPVIEELNSMHFARSNGNATILPNGKVFVNGGHAFNDNEFSIFVPEIYNPKTQVSVTMDRAIFRRNYHATSLLLPDGSILTAGGDVWNAEIFYPPYLFAKNWENKTILAKRTEIENLDSNIKLGEPTVFTISDEDISRVTLISTGSTTHAQGSESKFRELNFTKIEKDKIEITLPSNSNEIQDGTYMLFVLNSKGVPSNGKIVYVN